MSWVETGTTVLVLSGIFLLAYSALRKQGIRETAMEIKEIFSGKAADAQAAIDGMRYVNK